MPIVEQPTEDSRWADNSGATRTEPNSSKKGVGFINDEAPPAGAHNWLFWLLFRWVTYITGPAMAESAVAGALMNPQARVLSLTNSYPNAAAINDGVVVAVGVSGKTHRGRAIPSTGLGFTSWDDNAHGTDTLHGVAFGASVWCLVGLNDSVATSTDGDTWTSRSFPSTFAARSLVFVDRLTLFLASASGGGGLARSADGITWVISTPFGGQVQQIVDDGTTLFAISATNIYTSTDGITWNDEGSKFTGESMTTIVRRATDGVFVAAGAGGVIFTSTDGLTWVQRTPADAFGTAVTYADQWRKAVATTSGVFLLFGEGGEVQASGNGKDWVQRGNAGGFDFTTAAYDGASLVTFQKDGSNYYASYRGIV